MPFIEVKTNIELVGEAKADLKRELGDAITAIPGKSEAWLMVKIDDKADMWFKGDDSPTAIFEISIFGKANADDYDDLTKRICNIAWTEMGIDPERVYVKYLEIDHWGYNNFNF